MRNGISRAWVVQRNDRWWVALARAAEPRKEDTGFENCAEEDLCSGIWALKRVWREWKGQAGYMSAGPEEICGSKGLTDHRQHQHICSSSNKACMCACHMIWSTTACKKIVACYTIYNISNSSNTYLCIYLSIYLSTYLYPCNLC